MIERLAGRHNANMALTQVIRGLENGKIREEVVIAAASHYAVRNSLPFDGTIRGAVKLIEHADRTVREHMESSRAQRDQRSQFRPLVSGYDQQTGEYHDQRQIRGGLRPVDTDHKAVN